jgi:DNA-binding transcriptional LysR family regulator
MPKEHYSDLIALVAVAEARSFTTAAASLGISQSTLSHTVRQLEARVGVRLLTRTTRSVSLTEPGSRLVEVAAPRLKDIQQKLQSIADSGELPTGTVRIAACEYSTTEIVWPRIQTLIRDHPSIKVDLVTGEVPLDLSCGRFDIVVRLGALTDKDYLMERAGSDIPFVVVAAADMMKSIEWPSEPADLLELDAICLKSAERVMYPWVLKNGDITKVVTAKSRLAFNSLSQILDATLLGYGIAYLPETMVAPWLHAGKLVRLLESWSAVRAGYHLYYSNVREATRVVKVVIEALKLEK